MTDQPSPLARFSPVTRSWFQGAFDAPTDAQSAAWDAIARGDNALVIAPTGSGKTLAAFLWAIDSFVTRPTGGSDQRPRVLYVSPLKALAVDIDRNLRSPLAGIASAAERSGEAAPRISVAVRTGDTPQDERRRFLSAPPDILITTPESLFLLLTSRAREALRSVETVIVDEVHAVAGTKRGSHLALTLERLDRLTNEPAQRIGLSATVRPPEEVAAFLGGTSPVTIVQPPMDKELDLTVVVPVEDMAEIGAATGEVLEGSAAGAEARSSIWPHVVPRLLELIRAHHSTIVFANSRRLSERLCARLNELAGQEVARSHHGSVSREQRLLIEEELKAGRLPAVVATSSLELGIDMGAVDLVVQVEAPDSVASGLQRIGRAGHHVGEVSRGVLFPKYRGDLVECALVVERMRAGAIEATHYPRNPLDVLAQQIVAMVAMEDWKLDDLEETIRRAAPFRDLPRSALESVLDMLSGRYASSEFADLRPRIDWDRSTDVLSARPSAARVAVTSGGTIPDRGLFGVFLAGGGGRVGELDEEMVYESRPGEVFVLGASSWLIEEITHDRVLVSPAPGQPGKMPFWHGDALGRAPELGRALGRFIRELGTARPKDRDDRLRAIGLEAGASRNLIAYLDEQRAATGVVPDDRTIVIERFRDELGDWRICIHSPYGGRVHAPWAQAISARVREQLGIESQCMYSDDGIVVRLPDVEELPDSSLFLPNADEVEDLVTDEVGNSALFASRFRECAARSLLLPKRRPGSRSPLWQQRQKSAQLLQVARDHSTFPVVLEAMRECLQDVFDVPALKEVLGGIARREMRVVDVETPFPSPFASSLQFGYVSAFMYEGDAPLAERRAQALSLDRSLLAEIMGREELRELVDEESLVELELELQRLVPARKARDPFDLHDLLRSVGDLSVTEVEARVVAPELAPGWLEELESSRRALRLRIAGEERWTAIEDAGRWRDALGTPLPVGVPHAFLEPVADPLGDLIGRYARTHGPFTASDVAARFALGVSVVEAALRSLASTGRVVGGEFRPAGAGWEWIDPEVLRRLRRRSLAAFRKEIEPAAPEALGRLALAWHGLAGGASRPGGPDGLMHVIEQLEGAPIPASVLESHVLTARIAGYTPALLDELTTSGELVWSGGGAIGSEDGWVCIARSGRAPLLLPHPLNTELSDVAVSVRDALARRGAMFFRQISEEVGSTDDPEVVLAIWELVWAGFVTNDTLAPLRALIRGTRGSRSRGRPRRSTLPSRSGPAAAAGRWSLVPEREVDPTRRAHALAEQMLARHGLVTRGAVAAERAPGGFAGIYPVLKALEERGRCKRGYFVEGLGGAQFALGGAVDRLRALVDPRDDAIQTQVLAATDPANPYGAALPWPERAGPRHRPGRKAGAVVVLVSGALVVYVERGGKTVLSFTEDPDVLAPAVDALALAARDGLLGRLTVEKADGDPVLETPFGLALMAAGFRETSRGLRMRA